VDRGLLWWWKAFSEFFHNAGTERFVTWPFAKRIVRYDQPNPPAFAGSAMTELVDAKRTNVAAKHKLPKQ
jgi:hypothetical protein